MRGAKKTKNIPIIFVTATARPKAFLFKGYESGAVDFLLKPLNTTWSRVRSISSLSFTSRKRQEETLSLNLK